MTAVDAPPGLDFAGLAVGEFANRRRPRRLATVVLWFVLLAAVGTVYVSSRRLFSVTAELALGIALMCSSVALLGYLVRVARLRIGSQGVRWGWNGIGITLTRERLERVTVYDDAAAFEPIRGSVWYVSARDWDRFEDLPRALAMAELPYEKSPGRAPLRARLQSYGRALDFLLVLDLIAAVLGFVAGTAV